MEDFNHAIDFFCRVVKVEARACCPGHAEPPHQRLVAMMPAAQSQAVLVRECGEIVRVHRVHYKSNKRAALSGWPENMHTG